MAFGRDLSDPIQRRRAQFDDVMAGKRKTMKLDSVEHFAKEIEQETAPDAPAPSLQKKKKKAKKSK